MINNSEEWRRECEARGWIKDYRAKVIQLGKVGADDWWQRMKCGIEEKRGKKALLQLLADMNELKNAKGGKN